VLGAALLLGLMSAVALAHKVSTMLPNGAELSVQIDHPSNGTEFKVPASQSTINVDVDGAASIGQGEPDATIIYVIDRSGSTGSGSGTGCSPILGCEKEFFKNLNDAAIADGSTDLAAVVSYGSSASTDLGLTDPNSASVTNAINGLSAGGSTNCAAGLDHATTLAASGANTNGTTIVVFASDGACNEGGLVSTAAADLGDTGAIVHSVAIGSGSDCTTNGGTGTLNQIPQNGGSCTEVADPGDLPSIIQNLIGSTLESLAIEVDGGGFNTIPDAQISLPLPQQGAVSVTYGPTTVGPLGPADHTISVQAAGSDALGDTQHVTDTHTIHLLQLTASPATETNELGVDNEHTVTAEIVGGSGPNRDIVFAVTPGGTNPATPAGATINTPVNTSVHFNYTVPLNCLSLGIDTITVSTEIADMPDSIDLEKEWVDTTPPVPECIETVNPHGKKVPPAGSTTLPGSKGGQNEDGFYELLADDGSMDTSVPGCELELFVVDSGSGTVFGPFAVGDKIKYTEAPGATPTSKKMGSTSGKAGAIAAHITGNGDAELQAVDASGNVATVSCLVPPPPK
jgi:hypothetical protein